MVNLPEEIFDWWPALARASQLPPHTDWVNWLLLGGRGSGKTRAGAEWIRAVIAGDPVFTEHAVRRVALVGETYADAREVMVEGESGLLAVHHGAERPRWISSRRRLEWPNGAIAQVFSSEDPDALRGPQFQAAWCDAKTVWSSLVAVVTALLSIFGLDIDEQTQKAMAEAVLQMVTVAASLLAIFGRFSANSQIR